jgi:Protein of unknown function (DUF2442)
MSGKMILNTANPWHAEITHIAVHGVWVCVDDEELLLPYIQFPWFQNATVEQITAVERPSENHLYWPQLDVDLSLESLRHPEDFPLVWPMGSKAA